MKEGWTYKKLGDLCRVYTGKLDANAANDNGCYPFFTCAKDESKINNYAYDCECVIIAGNGDLNVKYYNGKFNAYQRTYIIESKEKEILYIKFLFWFMSWYITLLREQSIGSTIKYIKLGHLTEALIPTLSLSEQKAIVSRLDASFAHIDALKANAKKQLSDAKALFQKALEEAMKPKEGWEEKTLGDLGEFKNGINFAHNERGYDLFLLGVGDFGNLFSINDVKKLSKISLNRKPAEEYLLHNGDIVFVRSNGNKQLVGRSLVVYPNDIHVTFSGFCIRFRRKTNIINEKFLVSYLKSENTRNKLFGNGTNISNLNQKLLQNIIVPVPPLFEQQRIVERLDELSEKVKRLQKIQEKTIKECDALKQAILREVFE